MKLHSIIEPFDTTYPIVYVIECGTVPDGFIEMARLYWHGRAVEFISEEAYAMQND